jgi:putative transposase
VLSAENPGHTLHIVQRGYQQREVFFTAADRAAYLDLLREELARARIALHAYVLLGNHVHFLLTPGERGGIGRLMSVLNARHECYLATTRNSEGALWEARYKAMAVWTNRYALSCMRYIELNPVRARMVRRAEDFPWSSHRYYALGEPNELLTPHSAYAVLGRGAAGRQMAYRALFIAPPGRKILRVA